MKKGIILFDIDRTIYDTDKQYNLQHKSILHVLKSGNLKEIGRAKEDYKKTLEKSTDYNPEGFLRVVCEKFKFEDFDALLNVYYGKKYLFIYKTSVYPETVGILKQLEKRYKLGVFSEATYKFQKHKFQSMGISDYFDSDLIFIYWSKETKEAIEQIPAGSIIVDDKETICEFLTKNGIRAIWLNKHDDRESSNFETIHGLLELPQILLQHS